MVYTGSIMDDESTTMRIGRETLVLLDELCQRTRRGRQGQVHVLIEQALGDRPAEQIQHTPRMGEKQPTQSHSGAGDSPPSDETSPAPSPITPGGADG